MKKNKTEFVFVSLFHHFFLSLCLEKNMNLNAVIPACLEIVINIPVFLCIIRLIGSSLVDRPQCMDTEPQCLASTFIVMTEYVPVF